MAIQKGGFKRKSTVASAIPDSSLADIAFLLLIFFMVTTVFRSERKREITMPEADATERVDEKRKNILHVWVEQDGSVFINDQRMTPEQVTAVVGQLYTDSDRRLVLAVRSDRDVQYAHINDLMEQFRNAGALRVNLATNIEQRLSTARR